MRKLEPGQAELRQPCDCTKHDSPHCGCYYTNGNICCFCERQQGPSMAAPIQRRMFGERNQEDKVYRAKSGAQGVKSSTN